MITTIKRNCLKCGKEFEIPPSDIKYGRGKFCSRTCSKIGRRSHNWKGGKYNHSQGYVYIYSPFHPKCDKHGYVLEHRLVMEKYLGRFLLDSEIVHHINGIRNDNRIENLELTTQTEHTRFHWTGRKHTEETKRKLSLWRTGRKFGKRRKSCQ